MRRAVHLALIVSTLVVLTQGQASAGGGWWTSVDLDGGNIAVGESIEIGIREIWFTSVSEAKEGRRTPYYAYLVSDFDRRQLRKAMRKPHPGPWWEPVGPVIEVGRVTVTEADSNVSRGRLILEVPDMALGRYFLMLCDKGCLTPLANHIPVPVTVTADILAARTARRVDRMNSRLQLDLARIRHDVRSTERRLRDLRDQVNAEPERAPEPVSVPASPSDGDEPSPWIAYAGWFIAGGSVAMVFARRRNRAERSLKDLVPDDARDLDAGEPDAREPIDQPTRV